jgi:hypothetical protein
MDPHRVAEARSRAYHRLIAERLSPAMIAAARAQLDRWVAQGAALHPTYAEAWRRLLDGPIDGVRAVLEGDDERSATLRQVSPFAGMISPRERWALWRRVRRQLEELEALP